MLREDTKNPREIIRFCGRKKPHIHEEN